MKDYTKYVIVLKYTGVADKNEEEIKMGDKFNNVRFKQCIIILIKQEK